MRGEGAGDPRTDALALPLALPPPPPPSSEMSTADKPRPSLLLLGLLGSRLCDFLKLPFLLPLKVLERVDLQPSQLK